MVELCFGPEKNTRQSDWCKPIPAPSDSKHGTVRFTCGEFSPVSLHPGLESKDDGGRGGPRRVCQFGDIRVQLPAELPSSTTLKQDQFYHIIINVYVKNMWGTTRVGYLRFSPFDCWTYVVVSSLSITQSAHSYHLHNARTQVRLDDTSGVAHGSRYSRCRR